MQSVYANSYTISISSHAITLSSTFPTDIASQACDSYYMYSSHLVVITRSGCLSACVGWVSVGWRARLMIRCFMSMLVMEGLKRIGVVGLLGGRRCLSIMPIGLAIRWWFVVGCVGGWGWVGISGMILLMMSGRLLPYKMILPIYFFLDILTSSIPPLLCFRSSFYTYPHTTLHIHSSFAQVFSILSSLISYIYFV